LLIISVFLFLTLDTHYAHEIVGRVTELRASEVNGSKVVYSESCFVEVNDLALSKEH